MVRFPCMVRFHFSDSLKQLAKQMNLDLKFHWLNANKISPNASKTEYIIFKHALKSTNFDVRLFINGNRLIPSNYIKYLIVLLDSDLSQKSQINNVAIKLEKANGTLAILRHYVPPKCSSSGLLCHFPFPFTIL